MPLRRRYVVLLGLAVVALVVSLAVSAGGGSKPPTDRQLLAMELDALRRLRFPAEFVPTVNGCPRGRCYLVGRPADQVVADIPGLLRKSGIQPPGALRVAEPIALLKQGHWSTASRDPYVIACKTTSSPGQTPLTECQDAGRVGDLTLVNVLTAPYEACHRATCQDPRRTLVIAWSAAFPTIP